MVLPKLGDLHRLLLFLDFFVKLMTDKLDQFIGLLWVKHIEQNCLLSDLKELLIDVVLLDVIDCNESFLLLCLRCLVQKSKVLEENVLQSRYVCVLFGHCSHCEKPK